MITLWPFQEADQEKLAANNYTGLLMIEPGGGKTVAAITAMVRAKARTVLIVAPDSTHDKAWREDAAEIEGAPEIRIAGKKNKAERAALADLEWGVTGWYIVTPQFFTRSLSEEIEVDGMIVDEIHMLSEPDRAGQKKLSGYGAKRNSFATRTKHRLALSGTPARNNFYRMWSIMRFLWPELSGYGEVAQTPFSAWKDDRMAHEFDYFAYTKKRHTHEYIEGQLVREMPCVIVHKRRETCCEFHPGGFLEQGVPVVTNVTVDLTPKQLKVAEQLDEQNVAWLEDNPMVASLPIVKHIRLRQAVLAELSTEDTGEYDEQGNPKQRVWIESNAKSPFADEVERWLENIGDEPVVVFTASRIFAEYLTNRLNKNGYSAVEVSGATRKTRAKDLNDFGTKYRVAVAVIAAVGTGTDGMQKVAATEIWTDRDTDRTNNIQAQARLDRMGQTKTVQRIQLFDELGYGDKQYLNQADKQHKLERSLR